MDFAWSPYLVPLTCKTQLLLLIMFHLDTFAVCPGLGNAGKRHGGIFHLVVPLIEKDDV